MADHHAGASMMPTTSAHSARSSLRRLPVQTIVALVNELHFDLIVVGFRGHTRLYEQIIVSTIARLVRLTPCTILVVK
jgi:nucleotide-binding universal stress UspA family protein